MTEIYYSSTLLNISLTTEHWNALYDLALENKASINETASSALEEVLNQLIEQADHIDSLDVTNDVA